MVESRVHIVSEDEIERVVLCHNTSCPSDVAVESRLYHEVRRHYDYFEFNEEFATFKCRACGSQASEEFEIVEGGESIPVKQVWITEPGHV